MTTVDREKAESVVSRSSKKKKNRKKRARQWTGYVENLKTTIDCLYEMCRSEQSVAGCREAMLYLQSASNDFKSLIETINVEKEWEKEAKNEKTDQETLKRPSVAWEVRKSMSSPNPVASSKPLHPISSMIAEAVKSVSPPTQKTSEAEAPGTLTYARITAAAAVAAVAVSQPSGDDGWKVVTNRRRKSTSSTTVSEFDREISVEKEKEGLAEHSEPLNVYERLSSTSYKRGPGTTTPVHRTTLTCPRSAMDLPQTRASMAKMAYSRQLLWEKNQQVLVEKLRAKQKREKASSTGSRSNSQCGFTFADPQAVRKSVEAFNQQKSSRKSGKETTVSSQASNTELQSINEENPAASELSDDPIPADPTPSSSISAPPKSTGGGSLFGYVQVPEELEKDDEWREMTEEEESLALEENSLNLEIKQAESMSIDAELERQVEAEADTLEREHKRKQKEAKQHKKDAEMENFYKVFEEIRSLAWSELMEQESVAQYNNLNNVHEPGTPVEKHEKMSSPSRRRCQKDDDDFGRRHELKQRNAEMLRQQLADAKALKLKELTRRVEEVREKQEALKERKRRLLEERMQRAAENRDKNIMEVIRKAKDDDQRVLEVKFIATLQEDNKRYDLLAKDASIEEKQKQLADERARKHEEKAAKKREQEAAATARRQLAAEARQTRIRQLSEQKEQRAKEHTTHKKSSTSAVIPGPPDMLLFLNSLCSASPEISEDATWLWPSPELGALRECTLCSVHVSSDLEAALHLACSKEHQDQAKTLTSGSILDELKRHFYTVFVEKDTKVTSEPSEEDSDALQKASSSDILNRLQIGDHLPGPVTSPRNRTKYVREFNLVMEKLSSTAQISEKCQESCEKALAELLQAVEADQKEAAASSGVNLDQFCAISGPQKMCDALLEWTARGASLRLCIRMCHAFCTFLKEPRVAYSVIFKPDLRKLLDRLVELISNGDDVTSPQLSALLDVLTAILKSVTGRIAQNQQKHHQKFKELQKLDSHAPEAVLAIGSFLGASLSSEQLRKALETSRGPALCSRLIGLAEQIAVRGDSSLLIKFIDVIVLHTYSVRRTAETAPEADEKSKKTSKDVTSSIVATICQNPTILKACRDGSHLNVLMIVILLEDCLSRCSEAVHKTGNPEERAWGALTKDEEALIKLSTHLGKVVEEMEVWQKRSTMIPWTGRSSCLQTLEDVPIRLLTVNKHAVRLIPTIDRIMERLTNSERSELLGDTSGDLFFDNSLFPARANALHS